MSVSAAVALILLAVVLGIAAGLVLSRRIARTLAADPDSETHLPESEDHG